MKRMLVARRAFIVLKIKSVLLRGSETNSPGNDVINFGVSYVVIFGGDRSIDQLNQISNGVIRGGSISICLSKSDNATVSNVGLEEVITFVRNRHCLSSDLLREIGSQEFIEGKTSLGLITGKARRSAVLSICRSPLTLGNHMIDC